MIYLCLDDGMLIDACATGYYTILKRA